MIDIPDSIDELTDRSERIVSALEEHAMVRFSVPQSAPEFSEDGEAYRTLNQTRQIALANDFEHLSGNGDHVGPDDDLEYVIVNRSRAYEID